MRVNFPARTTLPKREQHGVACCARPGGLGQPHREGPCRPGDVKQEEPEGPAPPQAREPGEPGKIMQEEVEASPVEYQEN